MRNLREEGYTKEEVDTMREICEYVCKDKNQGIIGDIHRIVLVRLDTPKNEANLLGISRLDYLQDMQKMCAFIGKQPCGNGKFRENQDIYLIALEEINGELDKRRLEVTK